MEIKQIITSIAALILLTTSVSTYSLTKEDVDRLYEDNNYESIINLANEGNMDAQERLSYMYFEGKGVTKDHTKYLEWREKAAKLGHARAQHNLGYDYDKGIGVTQDYAKAMEWYLKAAAQGVSRAQTNIGVLYMGGKGIERDLIKGNEWYQKAADQGEPTAQTNLGMSYIEGRGVKQNFVKGNEWLKKSAEQGYAIAQYQLALSYLNGNGVEPEGAKEKGIALLKKAADQGFEDAQTKLNNLDLTSQNEDLYKYNTDKPSAEESKQNKKYRTPKISSSHNESIQTLYEEEGLLTNDLVTLDKDKKICRVSSIYSTPSSDSVLPTSLEIIFTKSTGKKTYRIYALKTDLSDTESITQAKKNLKFKQEEYALVFDQAFDSTFGIFSVLAEKKDFTFLKLEGHYPNDEALEVFERCIKRLKK